MQMLEIQKNKINTSQGVDPPSQHALWKLFIIEWGIYKPVSGLWVRKDG